MDFKYLKYKWNILKVYLKYTSSIVFSVRELSASVTFSQNEILKITQSLDPSKSPDSDKISICMIKHWVFYDVNL